MKPVLRLMLKAFFNPITLVSLFAPILILQISFLKLKDVLTTSSQYANNNFYNGLRELVSTNQWADTLVDINIQYVVLLVAFIFAIIQSISGIFSTLRNHNVDDIFDRWSRTYSALAFLIVSAIMIFGGIIAFLTGVIMAPEQINLYRENSADPLFTIFGMHAPPLTSYIFIFRALLSVYGVYLSYFIANTLPKMLSAAVAGTTGESTGGTPAGVSG